MKPFTFISFEVKNCIQILTVQYLREVIQKETDVTSQTSSSVLTATSQKSWCAITDAEDSLRHKQAGLMSQTDWCDITEMLVCSVIQSHREAGVFRQPSSDVISSVIS